MARFRIISTKKDNSHPATKTALRVWLAGEYIATEGESLYWLEAHHIFDYDIFDIDPYASPFEAVDIVTRKSIKNKIGIVCTDGSLRRAALMRTKIPTFLQNKCKWPERDLALLAAIYHQYPGFLRHVIACVGNGYVIEKLAVKYGKGTWKQATCYFAAVLTRGEIDPGAADCDNFQEDKAVDHA